MTPDEPRPLSDAAVQAPDASEVANAPTTTVFVIDLPQSGSERVREMLRQRFEAAALAWVYESDRVPGAISVEAFQKLPDEDRRQIQAVMGYFPYGLHQRPGPWFSYLAVLRDPVQRALVLHHDYQQLERAGRKRRRVEPTSVEDFVFGQQHLTVDNGYVRTIAGRRHVRFGQCPDDLYEEALDHIERRFSALLLHDEPERSSFMLARLIGSRKPLPVDPEPDVEPSSEAVGGAVLDRIRKLNRLDVRLYEYAKERFNETFERLVG